MEPQEIQDFLSAQTGQPVELVVTDNRWSLLSLRRAALGTATVRAARMFLDAPADVWRAIATCVRRRERNAWRRIRQFINEVGALRPLPHSFAPKRPPRIAPRGRVYDLGSIASELNAHHFGGAINAAITWGRAARQRGRRRITFGTYHHAQRLIRIHPRLDDARVPEFFVRYIVFHEMLHAAFGENGDTAARRNGRRVIHSREFRRREKEFHDYARALGWEKENLRLFLR
ncbi:MAG: hypothetical protein HZA91_10535 [Verrucomicrobia bacterium]|nr:hypothetical protein [Verrucomicrobiota bacterium]